MEADAYGTRFLIPTGPASFEGSGLLAFTNLRGESERIAEGTSRADSDTATDTSEITGNVGSTGTGLSRLPSAKILPST
nr:hypothetical protein [Trueperella pecoris]